MALNTNRYTYANNSVAADTLVDVATIPIIVQGQGDQPHLGIMMDIDFAAEASGEAYSLSAKLNFVIQYYDGGGSVVYDTVPTPTTGGTFNIKPTEDVDEYFHVAFPDISDWYNYFKVQFRFDPVSGQDYDFVLSVNSPRVNCQLVCNTTVYYGS